MTAASTPTGAIRLPNRVRHGSKSRHSTVIGAILVGMGLSSSPTTWQRRHNQRFEEEARAVAPALLVGLGLTAPSVRSRSDFTSAG